MWISLGAYAYIEKENPALQPKHVSSEEIPRTLSPVAMDSILL
jgi:hypothetical protein